MRKVLLRDSHNLTRYRLSTFQSCQLDRIWHPMSHIFTVRQYSTEPERRLTAKIRRLRCALTSVFHSFLGGRHVESFISKYKAEGKNDPSISSPTANTTPGPSSLPSRIMESIDALARGIKKTVVGTDPAINLTDTPAGIIKLIDSLARSDLPTSPPSVYIDLEGVNIGREGSISILQVFILPIDEVFLVDVYNLGEQAFSTENTSGITLKSILESQLIPKVIFDVRSDSDALFSHFGVKLSGVIDLQLMELATRSRGRNFVCGLAKCMDRDLVQTPEELKVRSAIKKRGKELFVPELGGRYEVFNDRPLDPAILNYCVQDVRLMPELWETYNAKLGQVHKVWASKIERETKARILLSQSPGYNGTGKHMAKAPHGW